MGKEMEGDEKGSCVLKQKSEIQNYHKNMYT